MPRSGCCNRNSVPNTNPTALAPRASSRGCTEPVLAWLLRRGAAQPHSNTHTRRQMDIGVFIPIGNNGWLISTTSPQYLPTFALNRAIVQKAEHYGLDFALSMIKLRGFGGKSEFWDYNLESFTLMAGLAAVTSKIKLYASVAVLTLPPPVVARMAVTIDSIAPGRFG